jgi:Flp pilus assembly pilin Flp
MHLLSHLAHRRLAFSLPLRGEEAQSVVEYALILSFVSIGALISVAVFGGGLLAMWATNLANLLAVL